MRYTTTRQWVYRTVPVLAVGLLGLMLLPARPDAGLHAAIVSPAGAAASHPAAPAPEADAPVFVKTSLIVPANEHTGPLPPAPTVSVAPPVVHLMANWSDYIKPSATIASVPAGTTDGAIGASAVNGHSGPGSGAPTVFVLQPGEPVKIAETSGGWVHVYRQSGESAWVYGRYLAGHEPAAAPPQQSADPSQQASAEAAPRGTNSSLVGHMARVSSPVPVLAAPDSYSAMLTVIEPGDAMRVTDQRGRWLRVTTSDGVSGWVPG